MSGDPRLRPYLELLDSFLRQKINVTDFERHYLDLFKADKQIHSDEIFEILDALFADVDAYSSEFGEDDSNLTERELRDRAAKAYKSLRGYAEPSGVEL